MYLIYNQFHFTPGQYYISDDLIFQNINNFSLIGIDQCVITCTSPASMLIINVTSFIFQNIKLTNCIKSHKEYFKANITHFDRTFARNTEPFSKVIEYHASVFLCNSSSVTISNIYVTTTVMKSFTAMLIVNVQNVSNIVNVKVKISSLNCAGNDLPVQISGIVVYYSDGIAHNSTLRIENLHYNNTYESCTNHFHCILTLLFLQNKEKRIEFELNKISISIIIKNSVFNNLKNSSILCYYGEDYEGNSRSVLFQNSIISNNIGHHQLSMFYIVLIQKSLSPFSKSYFITNIVNIFVEKKIMYNTIAFRNCVITDNRDMKAVIYVKPSTIDTSVGHIVVQTSTFQKNTNVNFIIVEKDFQTVWYVTTKISLSHVNISSNEHNDGDSLILVTSRILNLLKVIFNQNKYYRTIISLQSSLLLFQTYTEITNNFARHIIMAQSRSFLFIHVFKAINISNNVVYKTIKIVNTFEKNAVPICPFQGYDIQGSKVFQQQLNEVSFKLILLHNTEMISKTLPTEIISVVYKNCTWLKGSLFQEMKTDANTIIYDSILKYDNNTFVSINTTERVIPLTVCPCLNNSSYNCFKANVYSILPGQVLHVNLKVSPQWSDHHSTTLVRSC